MQNVWNESTTAENSSLSFVQPFNGSDKTVVFFAGHQDSYLLLHNDGALAVESFTWSAIVFADQTSGDGPLFNWITDDPTTFSWATHWWYLWQESIFYARLLQHGFFNDVTVSLKMKKNEWNEVAVSYDAVSGTMCAAVNAVVTCNPAGIKGQSLTTGDVVVGSSHYHSVHGKNRHFKGMITCLKLWRVAKDLRTLQIQTEGCGIP